MNKKMRSMKRGLSKKGIKTRKVKGLKGRKVNSFKSGKKINLVGGVAERKTFDILVTILKDPVLCQGTPEQHKFKISYVPEDDGGNDTESNFNRTVDTFSIELNTSEADVEKKKRGTNISKDKVLDTMYAVLDNSYIGTDDTMVKHADALEDQRVALYAKEMKIKVD